METSETKMTQECLISMHGQFPSVSARELVSSSASLPEIIARAKDEANRLLSMGSYVRRDATAGHPNSSLSSTSSGALTVASTLVGELSIPESKVDRLFGENIRETYYFFRNLFRRM